MTGTRRRFILTVLALATVLLLAAGAPPAFAETDGEPAATKRILFLGGTGFIGPHIVSELIDQGHEVTLFNRGNRAELFPEVELLRGNRIPGEEPGPGLEPLRAAVESGRRWDAVIDTANVHTWVEDSAAVLADAADHYLFVSSLSAYAGNEEVGQDEDAPLAEMPDEVADTIDRLPYDMQYFGPVKARCEAAAERHFPGRAAIVRPGLIVGPRDVSHRFTYWPVRIREGGEVLAPGSPDDPVQYIDVRDLAAFIAQLSVRQTPGVFNLNGPVEGPTTIGAVLEACREATGSDATFTWVDADFLAQQGVGPWMNMPVWIPPREGMRGFHRRSVERARKAGLETRPAQDTARDTLDWFDGYAEQRDGWAYMPGENAPGISREREAEVLAAWRAREADHEDADAEG